MRDSLQRDMMKIIHIKFNNLIVKLDQERWKSDEATVNNNCTSDG